MAQKKLDSVQNNSGRTKTERMLATIDLVKQQLVTNQQASIRRIEAQTGLKRSSVQVIIMKDLLMKPYTDHIWSRLLSQQTCQEGEVWLEQ